MHRFCTGSAKLPIRGFSELKPVFTITLTPWSPDRALPTASTCFNLFKLPYYPTESLLRKYVMCAILYGSEGFSFT